MIFENNPVQTILTNPTHPVSIAMNKMRDIPAMKYTAVNRWLSTTRQDRANFIRENFGALNRGAIGIIEGLDK